MRNPTLTGRYYYLDALRIIAICAIVLLHVAGSYWYELDVSSFDWHVVNAYDCMTRWGVPVFVMISGALFLDPGRPQPLRKLWGKNILHIVVLILFWGLFYALIYDRPGQLSPESLMGFLEAAIFGPQHLWFLFMLIGLYAIVPLLRCITANEDATRYFLAIGFVLNVALPLATINGMLPLLDRLMGAFMIQLPLGYSFYFVLGHYLASHVFTRRVRIGIYLLGLLGLVAATMASAWFSGIAHAADNVVIAGSCFFMFAATGIFVFVRQLFHKHEPSARDKRLVMTLSSCTLGVYVIHIFVLRLLMQLGMSGILPHALVSIPGMALLTCVLSFGIAYVLKKIPVFGSYFV